MSVRALLPSVKLTSDEEQLPMARLRFIVVLIMLAAVGCAPSAQGQQPAATAPIPTLASLPSNYLIEDAERVARDFLQGWADGDLETMFSLISFASQEATPWDSFRALYDGAHTAMQLEHLAYEGITIFRPQDELAAFAYNVSFDTRMLGEFTDSNRNLQLVVDARAEDWRVAWSPADIFPEMAAGARLRLDATVPNRANIYDSEGRILADQNGRVVTINVIRQDIPQYNDCLNALSAALAQPVAEVQAKLESRPVNWVMDMGTIEAQTYSATYQVLEQYCRATFSNRSVRRYANGLLAPHILGYVGYPDEAMIPALQEAGFTQESIIGRSGVEATWDTTLRGTPAARLVIVTPSGEVLREIARSSALPGESVWLTIDSDLQMRVQQIVADAFTQAKDSWAPGSNGASVVIMDIHTGDILAMVSYPTFDNNAYLPFPPMGRQQGQQIVLQTQADPRRPELNRPAQGVYPLGSVMKTISAAAVADSGVYALDERYTCTGLWNRDIPRTDWLARGHGTLTLAGALTNSCNPYFYEVGYQISQVDMGLLARYARQLGFGAPTGMTDLPEQGGLIGDPEWLRVNYGLDWTFSDNVNMSIGQGYVQVTPLQVVRWFASIANNGTLPHPRVVRQVGLLGESLHETEIGAGTPINIRTEVLDVLRQGMCEVTTAQTGTAEFVFRNSPLQSIGVCGKTGTAQNSGEGVQPTAWFAAYAPRENPEIAVVVMVETAGEGSGVAAPITRQVLEAYFDMEP